MTFVVSRGWLVVVLMAMSFSPLLADGFRIETKIFVGEADEKDKKEPVSTATTLCLDGVFYDFLENPDQTAVFRRPTAGKPGRFILLNDRERVSTEVSTDNLVGAMTKLRTWASRQTDPYLQFAANPKFQETFDRNNGKLILASHLETYTVDTTPTQRQDSLNDYRQFLDWYAQLNTLLSQGNPPDPRLKLNDALARHKVVPMVVSLKREGQDPLRAEHDFVWRLSKDDLQRIDDVAEAMTSYRKLDNAEFLKLEQSDDQNK